MDFWYQRTMLSYVLYPLSLLYRSVVFLRKTYYQHKRQQKFPVPIIVIGNITVGGTGKSPLIIKLVQSYQQLGYKPGVVSRGYGGEGQNYPLAVNHSLDPKLCGDEPVMIAKRCQCPVVVDPKRPRAIEYLLANNDCDVVLSDDGLQHYAMYRDFEVVVMDGQRRLGNGFCLPAGPLREPKSRLKQADLVITNGQARLSEKELSMRVYGVCFRAVADPKLTKPLDAFSDVTVHAVSGIGNPQRFYTSLVELGITSISQHIFSDHHKFTADDFVFTDGHPIIITEKDAVKCSTFATESMWYLEVDCEIAPEALSTITNIHA